MSNSFLLVCSNHIAWIFFWESKKIYWNLINKCSVIPGNLLSRHCSNSYWSHPTSRVFSVAYLTAATEPRLQPTAPLRLALLSLSPLSCPSLPRRPQSFSGACPHTHSPLPPRHISYPRSYPATQACQPFLLVTFSDFCYDPYSSFFTESNLFPSQEAPKFFVFLLGSHGLYIFSLALYSVPYATCLVLLSLLQGITPAGNTIGFNFRTIKR